MKTLRWAPALVAVGVGHAHFALLQPPSALSIEDGGKGAPPCAEGPASNVVTDAQGGHPIAIRLNEFVFHPGHYRFALAVNSRAELPADPQVVTDADDISVSAAIQNPVRIPVLADGVFLHTAPPTGDWQTSLVLPNLSCDRCTLQIIEFMAEHGANPGGGYFYHHCSDLRIKADPTLPPAESAWPRAVTQTRAAFAHVTAGGGWITTLALINTSAAAVPATVTFRDDDGNPLLLINTVTQAGVAQTAASRSVNAVVGPNATVLITTGDQIADNIVGWADVQSSGPLGGFVVFRSTSGSGPPSDGSVPLAGGFASAVTLPFDNTSAFVTGIALANAASVPVAVSVAVWDDAGNLLGTGSLTIAGGGHTSFVLADRMKVTAGKRGIVRFQSADAAGIAALGLRFAAAGGFTSLPGM